MCVSRSPNILYSNLNYVLVYYTVKYSDYLFFGIIYVLKTYYVTRKGKDNSHDNENMTGLFTGCLDQLCDYCKKSSNYLFIMKT